MKLFTKTLFQLIIVAAILLLFSGHFSLQARHEQLKLDFDGHWHYEPKDYNAELTQRKLLENPGYNLTKPKPKWQTQSQGYIFWSYNCGSKQYDAARPR